MSDQFDVEWPEDIRGVVLREIYKERIRQEELKQAGKFIFTCADKAFHPHYKLAVLAEEFGKVARHVADYVGGKSFDRNELRTELIQVAAVAAAWAESMTK